MAESVYTLAEYNAENARALDILINDYEVQLKKFPEDVLEAMAKHAKDVIEETAAGDELTGRIYESFEASKARTSRWSEISEGAYMDARGLLPK